MIDLNYSPKIVVDTKNITREEWLKYRKCGIGGSEVGAVFGVSPFKTTRDLYYEKLGLNPEKSNNGNWVQLKYGNLLEDLVAEIFSFKTGFKIEKDKVMYAHPKYNFMQANLDFITYDVDNKKCLLECKTTTFNNRDKWLVSPPFYYVLQCRHEMAVMNIDVCYLACLWDNNADSFIYYKIDRDLELEEELIKKEKFFWFEYVWNEVPPSFTEDQKLILDCLKKFKAAEPPKDEYVKIPDFLSSNIIKYLSIRDKRLSLSSQVKTLESFEKSLYAPIVDELNHSSNGFFPDNSYTYFISNKPQTRTTINKSNLEKLKLKYPDIYNEFVTTSVSQSFSIKKKEMV